MARAGLTGRIADGLQRLTRENSDGGDPFWFSSWWSTPSATGLQINQQTALQNAAVMACVRILAEDVSKMTPGLFKRIDNGKHKLGERVPLGIKDHPLAAVLHRPNDWQTWPEFCRQMVVAFALRGNAFAVILRNRRGDPVMLVPINPDRVQLWQSPGGGLFWMVTRSGLHELYVLRNEPFLIPYEDVLHLKDLSADGLVGVSPITLQCETIALGIAQRQQYARLIGNGARPSGVLTTDQKLTASSAERLRDDWNKIQQGLLNSGKTAILEQGLKWQALSVSSVDLQFLQILQFGVIDVCRIFRVPPHMVGDLSKGTFSNIVQQGQEYRNNTLTSHTDIWEHRFDFTFGLKSGNFEVDFDESKQLKADLTARFNAHRVAVLTGWQTRNEVRVEENLPPLPGLDEPLIPLNEGPGSDLGGDNPGAGKSSEDTDVDNQPLDPAPGT